MSTKPRYIQPQSAILSLQDEDLCLIKRADSLSIPPNTFDEECLLAHHIIRQSTYAGTHILHHLFQNPPGKGYHLVALLLYRHALDLGDSIGTLSRFGASNTIAILIRSLFETNIGLEFLLEDNSFHEDRAICYQTFRFIERLNNQTRFDPGTVEGAELHAILDSDQRFKDAPFARKNLSEEREVVKKILDSRVHKPIWENYKSQKPKPKHWYSMCSRANNLRTLAKLVRREPEYLLLYKMLSEVAHASDVISGVMHTHGAKTIEVHKLRGPFEKLREATTHAANYLLSCHHLVLDTYLKDHAVHKAYRRWYVKDYRHCFFWGAPPSPQSNPSPSNESER